MLYQRERRSATALARYVNSFQVDAAEKVCNALWVTTCLYCHCWHVSEMSLNLTSVINMEPVDMVPVNI